MKNRQKWLNQGGSSRARGRSVRAEKDVVYVKCAVCAITNTKRDTNHYRAECWNW